MGGKLPVFQATQRTKPTRIHPCSSSKHERTSFCIVKTTTPSLAHSLVLSELLLALDEADDSLRDIHWDARDLMQIRAHILALQHRLHLQIHRLYFRIIFQATSQTLP